MIDEDYINFETAKLLKKKGFNEPCYRWYDGNGDVCAKFINPEIPFDYSSREYYLCPTHQMVLKKLREEHKLHIAILWDNGACIGKNSFRYHIDRMDNYEDKAYNKIGFDSNEEACEEAIKYCYENLI